MNKLFALLSKKLNAQSGFLKSLSILVGGTVFAQMVTVLSLPIITRLYTPEQFSIFAIYVSILSILGSVCCLRFEIAIPIPEKNREACSLSVLAILSSVIFSILLSIALLLFSEPLLRFIGKIEIIDYVWLLPLGLICTGLFTAFQYWAIRQKQYSIIAKANVFQAGGGASVQIVLALMGCGVLGLILGQIVKSSFGILKLTKNFLQDCYNYLKEETLANLVNVFRKNIRFPKYSLWEALANTASIQLPIMYIAILSTNTDAGFLMLAMQILAIPITFIGRSVSQIYLAEAPSKVNRGEIEKFTLNVLEKLCLIGGGLLVFIGILSPTLAKYIFGEQWADMGLLISWMIPWFIFQLISSPISMIMHITGKQKQALLLTIFGLVLKMLMLGLQYTIDPSMLVESFAISSAIFYAVAFSVFLKAANVSFLSFIKMLRNRIFSYFVILSSGYALFEFLKYLEV